MNLFEEAWEAGNDRPGYAARERAIGKMLAATLWGATLYELQPGARVCPYHYHFGEEEWLLVVAGSPTLRTPDGERALRPWDVAVFPRGPSGAHDVRNDGDETACVLLLSTKSDPEVCVYPDSGKVGVFAGWQRADGHEVKLMNRPETNLDYYEGEA